MIEFMNLVALLLSQRAIALGISSLVAAVETIIPAYLFIFSVGLHRFNLLLGDLRVLHCLRLKLLLGGMMAGVVLVS